MPITLSAKRPFFYFGVRVKKATPRKMKITEDAVPHCGTAEQGIAEEEALKKGMEEKSRQFAEKGAEI